MSLRPAWAVYQDGESRPVLSAKCWLQKHGELCLFTPQHPHKKVGAVACTLTPKMGGGGDWKIPGAHWPPSRVYLASCILLRNPVSSNKAGSIHSRRMIPEAHLCLPPICEQVDLHPQEYAHTTKDGNRNSKGAYDSDFLLHPFNPSFKIQDHV